MYNLIIYRNFYFKYRKNNYQHQYFWNVIIIPEFNLTIKYCRPKINNKKIMFLSYVLLNKNSCHWHKGDDTQSVTKYSFTLQVQQQ